MIMENLKEIIIDNIHFQKVDIENFNQDGFLFDLGEIFICPSVTERFTNEVIRKRLRAHGRREVGEYNQWLMTDEEISNIKLFFEHSKDGGLRPSNDEITHAMNTSLPEPARWIASEIFKTNPDMSAIKDDILKYLPGHEAHRLIRLIESYLNPPDLEIFGSHEDFWEHYIMEEKSLESIENDETIDSQFLDHMIIMTTPRRRATVIYMEDSISRIFDFYALDKILAPEHEHAGRS